ncbi:hypothetical protein GGI19_002198 [Coemansia pectinata]|uniref:GST N-terminal domain-containing protein n=1 Tax=Coemansia pectinata TaxID=1052879 RepID=A0A9W8GXM0_9FUNG|nr:hypothetical protein GGI19_002198 [Coemansia pectinata]
MTSYIFRYFNIVGLGETTRLLLTAAKVRWTEESSDFEQGKLDNPNGCPVVLIQKSSDGSPDLVFNEFIPMERYLARTYGFLPADPSQAALQEQLRDEQRGVMKNLLISVAIGIEATQVVRDLVFIMFEERLEKFINAHTELLRKNGNTGYSFSSTLSYADLMIYSFMRLVIIEFAQSSKDIARRFKGKMTPELAKLAATVEADPLLEAYVSQRGKFSNVF